MSKDIKAFCQPDSKGFFGAYGGQYVPDAIKARLDELDQAFKEALADPEFTREMQRLLLHFAGRPSPVFHCRNLSKKLGGAQIWLKREDLNHLGAHKVNNTIGQCLLAKRMGKTRVIAETGAGQHGVGTAASAALMGLDVRRTRFNAHIFCSVLTSIGAICYVLNTMCGTTRQALGLEMDAISSAVIGGTLLTGGVGNVFGSFFGVLINGTISSLVKTNGKLSSSWPNVVTALLLCFFIVLQAIFAKVKARRS